MKPGGCFVIEVGIPDLRRLPPGQKVVPFHVSPARWAFDVYDVASQAMSSNYAELADGRGEYTSIPSAIRSCRRPGDPLARDTGLCSPFRPQSQARRP